MAKKDAVNKGKYAGKLMSAWVLKRENKALVLPAYREKPDKKPGHGCQWVPVLFVEVKP